MNWFRWHDQVRLLHFFDINSELYRSTQCCHNVRMRFEILFAFPFFHWIRFEFGGKARVRKTRRIESNSTQHITNKNKFGSTKSAPIKFSSQNCNNVIAYDEYHWVFADAFILNSLSCRQLVSHFLCHISIHLASMSRLVFIFCHYYQGNHIRLYSFCQSHTQIHCELANRK